MGKVPIDMVGADQLQTESGWSYEEMSLIVGNLYLDSHHRISTMNEKFNAISAETRSHLEQKSKQVETLVVEKGALQLQVDELNNQIDRLEEQASQLKIELEIKDGSSNGDVDAVTPSVVGDDEV